MIAWYWLIPTFLGGLAFGLLVAALCVAASRDRRDRGIYPPLQWWEAQDGH